MRSRQNTGSQPAVARRAPAGGRGGRRRSRPAEVAAVANGGGAVFQLPNSPEALYRAEKARRTTATASPDDAAMAEAKRLYDEAIAETGKKRAGMRSAVVPPGKRRGGADPVNPDVDSAEGEAGPAPSGTYEADQ